MKRFRRQFCFQVLFSFTLLLLTSSTRGDALDAGFQNPPDSARPHTWWHWMNGNVTKEGITADLEAMKRVGIGGAQIFTVNEGIPAGPAKFLSPEWRELMKFAASEADRLGIELCLHNCAGWSSSGGPWNTPSNAMQHVVTSEVQVKGPSHFSDVVPQPRTTRDFYREIAVYAFGTPTPGLRIEKIRTKDGDDGGFVMSSPSQTEAASSLVIKHDELIDLTSKLSTDGHLDWDAPAGDWTILRIGYTPTGRNNHPAPPEGTGLECDKFSKAALDAHWNGFVQKVLDDLGPLAGKSLNNVLIDSYEVGGQNWSGNFRAEFQKRRGYDPLPYMPTFTGRVVDSPEISERFLWDVRRTIADLFAENYYGHFKELCRKHGVKASIEPYTGPFESLQCGGPADIVMGEFWVGGNSIDKSVKLASTVGHIYGLPIIGAESFTAAPSREHGRWIDDAYSIKARGDSVFCQGVNRYIFHRFAMQPWTNRWPGMTMGQWGTHFDRTSTWFEQGREWLRYVARCQFLLQQGRFAADVAYFCGESTPVEMRVDQGEFALPEGYDYDGINADVLLHHAKVQDGKLVLDSGMSYRVLVLPPSDRNMTPELLRKLRDFVSDGLVLVGHAPSASPSLQNYPKCDEEVQKLVGEMWGENTSAATDHKLGKGKVVWSKLSNVLADSNTKPDFTFTRNSGSQLTFIHRRVGDAEIYFVSNQRQKFDSVDCTFRVTGKVPELWHADTGVIERAPVWHEENGSAIVPLHFDPAGSVFVVFRSQAEGDHIVAVESSKIARAELSKPAKLKILDARYGAFSDGRQKWLDVTSGAKALLSSGARQIPANNDFAGDDPAPNIVKRLRVEFRVNGAAQTAEAQEGDRVNLPAGSSIIKAIYGDLQPVPTQNSNVDVTPKLARLISNNELHSHVGNELAGSDLAPLTPKELRVRYSVDGVVKQATVPEGESLDLPNRGSSIGTPQDFEVEVPDSDSPAVLAFAAGEIKLKTASGKTLTANVSRLPKPQEISGPWQLSFPPNWGAPESVTLDTLISWSDSELSGVKYFSGTATYQKEIAVPSEMLGANREVWLDLGSVKNFAEVSLNGKAFPVLWKPPFRLNITSAAKPGKNKLEIKVTNLWPNRLIGDEQLPDDREWTGKRLKEWPQWVLDGKPSPTGRFTFTTWHHWTKNEPLLESGLLGPVIVRAAVRVPAK